MLKDLAASKKSWCEVVRGRSLNPPCNIYGFSLLQHFINVRRNLRKVRQRAKRTGTCTWPGKGS